jgi:apolipoprotein N-acyltransferase
MNHSSSLHRYGLLFIGAALLCFANGRWIFPVATWVAPVFFLRFLHLSSGWRPLLLAFALYSGAFLFSWQRMVPAPLPLYIVIVIAYAVVYFVPYLLHRAIAPHLRGIGATLVFPTAWIMCEYLAQTFLSPYGSWFALAYTQVANGPLLQLASVTGTWGTSFLITWVASIAAATWAAEWNLRKVRVPAAVAAIALSAVLLGGWIRLGSARNTSETVRVAAVVPNPDLARALDREVSRFRRSGQAAPEDDPSLGHAAEAVNSDLINRTYREATAGAAIVAWSETAARVLKSQELKFLSRLSATAVAAKIHLFAGYGVYTHGAPKPLANRLLAIDPDGQILWAFDKAHPITGGESMMLAPGDGKMRVAKLANAAVTAAICHDFDFPPLIRQASKHRATLLLAPSADWPEITGMHADMALMRAVENGIPLVRPAAGGRTFVSDSYGVVLSRQDAPRDALVATVKPDRVATIYGRFGDFFAYLCIGGFLFLAARAIRSRRVRRSRAARSKRVPALAGAAVLLLGPAFAQDGHAQQKVPLAEAEAALETCIVATRNNDQAKAKSSADRADELYAEAERSGARTADVLTGRARVLSQCRVRHASFLQQPGLVKQSIALLQRAIAADPDHIVAHYTLAMNYYSAPKIFGQSGNALRELELIIRRWGDRRDLAVIGDSYYFLGRMYERQGRTKEAQAAWKRGAELFPANSRLKRAAQAGTT